MKTHTKIILLLAGISLSFIGYLYYYDKSRVAAQDALVHDEVNDETRFTESILGLVGRNLKTFASDYAYWDDMVRLVQTGDKKLTYDYIRTALPTYGADAAWVVRPNFTTVYSFGQAEGAGLTRDKLKAAFSRTWFPHFFLDTGKGMMEVYGAPVQPAWDEKRTSAPAGYFLTGRMWDEEFMAGLSRLTGDRYDIRPATGPTPAPGPQDGRVYFSFLRNGYDGRPLFRLVASCDFSGYQEVRGMLAHNLNAFTAFFIMLVAAMFFSLNRWVSRPLAAISGSLEREDPALLDRTAAEDSEFGMAARIIKRSFDQKKELEFGNLLLTTIQETSLDGVIAVDGDSRIISCNHRFAEIFGVPRELVEAGDDGPILRIAASRPADREGFLSLVRYMYEHRDEMSMNEIPLKDGRVLDGYSSPMLGTDETYYGRVWNFRDVTGRKLAEEALREERNKLENILGNIGDGISIQDSGFRILFQNRKQVEMMGQHTGELCYMAYAGRGDVCEDCPVAAAFADGGAHHLEKAMQAGGQEVYLDIIAAPLRDLAGNMAAVVESVRDVTERKQADEALGRRLVMETAISRMSSALLSGSETDINDVLKLLGEAAGADHAYMHLFDEGLGTFAELNAWCAPGADTGSIELLRGLDLGGFGHWMEILKAGGDIYAPEIAALPEGDSLRLLSESLGEKSLLVVPMASGGRLRGILGFDSEKDTHRWSQDDIGLVRTASGMLMAYLDRRRAEEALKESEEKFRTLVEDSIAGVYILHNGIICYSNPRCAGIFGYTVDEFMGRAVMDMIHPEDGERAGRDMWEAISGRAATSFSGFRGIKKDGGIIHVEVLGSMTAYGGSPAMIGTLLDVTERVRAEALLQENERRMEHLAHHDTLTGLPNRLLFNDRLEMALALARRKGGSSAVMLFDLDRFKSVNDTLGHPAGDRVLQDVAERLSGCMRECDTFARVGGDEFCIIISELDDIAQAESLARRVLDTGGTPYPVDGHELRVTLSMGIAVFPDHGEDATALMKNADIALYRAKNEGRDNFKVYSAGATPAGR